MYGKYVKLIDMKIKDIPKDIFTQICKEEKTMARAAKRLGLHFNTFKKYALRYECYIPNQAGKGIKKNIKKRIIKLEDYATRASVRKMVIQEELLKYECKKCGISNWEGKQLSLHLDHINGNSGDHRLENLRFLCPNCHSQTNTYTGKNK